MKPKYIFIAVFAICMLMGVVLPGLSRGPRVAAAQGLAPTSVPATSIALAQVEQAAPIKQAVPEELAAQQPVLAANSPGLPIQPTIDPSVAGQAVAATPTARPGARDIPLTANLPDLASFAASLPRGEAGQLVGVYAPGQFALPVVEQPAGDANYVSDTDEVVTRYRRPAPYGVTGLLAHNTLSGSHFSGLREGSPVILLYGNGTQVSYRISRIDRFQALSPDDVHSSYIDLDDPTKQVLSDEQVFSRIYTDSGTLVLQTCIARYGVLSWGRLFITAEEVHS